MSGEPPSADALLAVHDACPGALDDETLDTIEREGDRPWLMELVRVYRMAKAFDLTDDVSPYHRFFALDWSGDGKKASQ